MSTLDAQIAMLERLHRKSRRAFIGSVVALVIACGALGLSFARYTGCTP